MNTAKVEEGFNTGEMFRDRFTGRLPSNAEPPKVSERLDRLVLPDEARARMPLTKDKYVVKENPQRVAWEREVRKFLRRLSPEHGHRVAAVMIYEWATGKALAEMRVAGESANADLRHINFLLREYFGKPYMTYICGRKIPKAYRIPPGWLVTRHRPITLTLYVEYLNKTLSP